MEHVCSVEDKDEARFLQSCGEALLMSASLETVRKAGGLSDLVNFIKRMVMRFDHLD